MKIKYFFLAGILAASALALAQTADALFQAGKFTAAGQAYSTALAANPKDSQAHLRLGQLALYGNRFDEAERHLRQALAQQSEEAAAKSANALLGEAFYRRDNYPEAAKFKDVASGMLGMEMSRERGDYAAATSLKFVLADPLPVVQAQVNGGQRVYFLIDTGGPEVVLDKNFAATLRLQSTKGGQGTLAEGKKATIEYSRITSLQLGDFVVKNLPVNLLPLPELGAYKLSGILGTELLYHFLPTLDYPGGQLILRKKSGADFRPSQRAITVPFWLAGDHFMVAWGQVNQSPQLLFVDSGFAGGGFLCPPSTLQEAGIALAGKEGQPVSPFVVENLALGDARGQKIDGLTGVFPPSLENQLGFRIGGLISHQFFVPYAVTFDFEKMRLILDHK